MTHGHDNKISRELCKLHKHNCGCSIPWKDKTPPLHWHLPEWRTYSNVLHISRVWGSWSKIFLAVQYIFFLWVYLVYIISITLWDGGFGLQSSAETIIDWEERRSHLRSCTCNSTLEMSLLYHMLLLAQELPLLIRSSCAWSSFPFLTSGSL